MADGRPGVLIVDDHIMIAQAMAGALRSEGFDPVEHLPADQLTVEGALSAADRSQPAVALVDLNLGGGSSGLSIIAALAARGVRVVAFSANESSLAAAESLEMGAAGFLNKAEPFDVIASSVRRAAAGEALIGESQRAGLLAELRASRVADDERLRLFDQLSPRERDVLRALMAGRSAQEIADQTFVSVRTVRSHIEAIRGKLGVKSQLAAVALARDAGWPGG